MVELKAHGGSGTEIDWLRSPTFNDNVHLIVDSALSGSPLFLGCSVSLIHSTYWFHSYC